VVELDPDQQSGHRGPDGGHDGEDRVALPQVADDAAERTGEAERDHQDEENLNEVRQPVRVLERVRRVRVVEPATVRPELLDHLLARHRTAGNGLRPACEGRDGGVAGEVLHDPVEDQHDAEDHRDRQQNPDRDPGQVDPEVAKPIGMSTRQPPDERDGHRNPDRG
jgi:hypothetical protein